MSLFMGKVRISGNGNGINAVKCESQDEYEGMEHESNKFYYVPDDIGDVQIPGMVNVCDLVGNTNTFSLILSHVDKDGNVFQQGVSIVDNSEGVDVEQTQDDQS